MKNFRMIIYCLSVLFSICIAGGHELWAQDIWGDINSDGYVNDADTQILTACILGNGDCKYCDLNSDGQYNIQDVQLLTNAIDVNKFIVWTLVPLHRLATDATTAARAKKWIKNTWLTECGYDHSHISIFDFWGYAFAIYEGEHEDSDSHPNLLANQTIEPIFLNLWCR